MFAAASGARLAHRHAKPAVRKQTSAGQLEDLRNQIPNYKAVQIQQQRQKLLDHPPVGLLDYTAYVDLNTRVSKLDLEADGLSGQLLSSTSTAELLPIRQLQSKAAWQDREHHHHHHHRHDPERKDSCGDSDGAFSHRNKQIEAHKRWVRKNRIHDASLGECSSDADDLYGPYGVHAAVANALLYIGLGTMALGMIITFVGTGEKGFKTVELRFIGPSLCAAGFLIILFRILLCVCPSTCLRHRHKHKNTMSKLNSEDKLLPGTGASTGGWKVDPGVKKVVSIATTPTTINPPATSTVSVKNEKLELTTLENVTVPVMSSPPPSAEITVTSLVNGLSSEVEKLPLSPATSSTADLSSKTGLSKKASKYESTRVPRNTRINELLLSPTKLEDVIEDP